MSTWTPRILGMAMHMLPLASGHANSSAYLTRQYPSIKFQPVVNSKSKGTADAHRHSYSHQFYRVQKLRPLYERLKQLYSSDTNTHVRIYLTSA